MDISDSEDENVVEATTTEAINVQPMEVEDRPMSPP